MNKLLYLFLFMSTLTSVTAQQVIEVPLWPMGLPNTNGEDHLPADESKRNFAPSIYVYLPQSEKPVKAVVDLPGGGYGHLAYHHEGFDWAPFFMEQNMALVVVKYRMPKGVNKDVPASDVIEAIRVIRENAQKWNINPDSIGVMGFSAGGHLASTIATHYPELNLKFQLLFYPVISMDPAVTHGGSRHNLLGPNPSQELQDLYSNEKRVTAQTPKAFIALSDDDKAVIPQNSVAYYQALKAHHIPASLHIYPSGGHGWGVRPGFKYHKEMIQSLTSWLKTL